MSSLAKVIILMIPLFSCNNINTNKEIVLSADMQMPLGHKYLNIYADSTFTYQTRRLQKTEVFEGKVTLEKNILRFDYTGTEPDVGSVAEIDGIFLTYTDGVYRELLEISLNELVK